MPLNWPKFEIEPSNASDANGSYINKMVDRELAQSAANHRALQAAKATEAKRLRQESLDAAKVLNVTVSR
jgi:hypothetical protein